MSPDDIQFDFEQSVIQRSDGKSFQPLRDSKQRWIQGGGAAAIQWPEPQGVIYQLHSGEYVFVQHKCFTPQSCVVGNRIRDIWHAHTMPRAKLLSREMAFGLLQVFKLPIPIELQDLAAPRATTRSLDYWKGHELLVYDSDVAAHEVKIVDWLQLLLAKAVAAVHVLRGWRLKESIDEQPFIEFSLALFIRFPVDPLNWWGPKSSLPPLHVDHLKLRWPAGSEEIQRIIKQLRECLEGPAAAYCSALYFERDEFSATFEEQQVARAALLSSLPEIEALVVRLQTEIHALGSAEQFAELQKRKGKLKAPSDKALLVYRLYVANGGKQKNIAKAVEQLSESSIDQGTVSRSIRDVEEWLEAGNILPSPLGEKTARAQPMDPALLELGLRQRAGTPRQRERKDSE